jgi:1D-myo-inositol 3-kinase
MCHAMLPNTEILVAGNYCHDTLIQSAGSARAGAAVGAVSAGKKSVAHQNAPLIREVLGGSAAYISAAFKALDVNQRVIAKVGRDFRYAAQVACPPLVETNSLTTHFVDDHTTGARSSILKAECAPILPSDLGHDPALIAIACGVAREIQPETLVAMRGLSQILIADLQGLIRTRRESDGQVVNRPFSESAFREVIHLVDFLKVGEEELPFIDVASLSERVSLIITLGAKGCRLVVPGQHELHIPAYPTQAVDTTGAGDCFVAGFAYALLRGGDIHQALRSGSRLGALAVSQLGVPDFTTLSGFADSSGAVPEAFPGVPPISP